MTTAKMASIVDAEWELVREVGDSTSQRTLTIMLPSYRHEQYIKDCLHSINACARSDQIDLLVIDDGSPDGTLQKICDFPFNNALHVSVYSKPNRGLLDSASKGMKLVTTRYVAFIASDDRYCTSALDAVIRKLAAHRGSDICWVFPATYLEGRDGEPVYDSRMIRIVNLEPAARLKALSIEYPKPLLVQSSLFTTNLLREIGAWTGPEELDDWPVFLRVAERAERGLVDFRFCPEPVLMRYRLHPGGSHNDTARQLRICLEVVNNVVRPEFRREGISRVYSDISLIHLNEGRWGQALQLYWHAFKVMPSLGTLLRGPIRIARAAWKRAR